ncbi:hypothetical protein ABT052_35805 [Streptomyces sp. NPDC002766]|uniref:hypothetical protein n=1 Tax=Streptomyces sp. NPDC002766 TaxID=3154429 RepID=UPI00332FDB5C
MAATSGTAPRRSKLDPFKPVIDQMLLADLDAPRKQRHSVVRIYRRLINEHAMDDVSYQPSTTSRNADFT